MYVITTHDITSHGLGHNRFMARIPASRSIAARHSGLRRGNCGGAIAVLHMPCPLTLCPVPICPVSFPLLPMPLCSPSLYVLAL